MNTSVILPDGRVFPSASFAIISAILNDLKTKKVSQFQIVQRKIDEIDILIVIDEDLRDVGVSVDLIIKHIKEAYERKVGPDVTINVKEVKEIKSSKGKPSPLLISHVAIENGYTLVD
jgi:phenylacetate-coenzyme A ligase PaaK-like adenylate-forming protein